MFDCQMRLSLFRRVDIFCSLLRTRRHFPGAIRACPFRKIVGPYDGKLSNSGEKLQLSMPGDIDAAGERHYIRVDRVNYSDGSHHEDAPGSLDLWPIQPDGGGKSLRRRSPADYTNDPENWTAAPPSPGGEPFESTIWN